jgi:pSer/pThr/pTyr-binding forkhead associated (FHA) protein
VQPRSINACTILPLHFDAWQVRARHESLAAAEAYRLALAVERARPRQDEIGYRLYWLGREILGGREVRAERGGHVVVGRHTSCDVVIEDEDAISLRHALVRASALDDGLPVLNVMDLDSRTGFELSDGSKQRAVVATGPIVFRIGKHTLVALPSTGRLPDELCPPVVTHSAASAYRVDPRPSRAEPCPRMPTGRITVVSTSAPLSDRRPFFRDGLSGDGARGSAEPFAYEVMLRAFGRSAGVALSKKDVEHGILIGRAHKCVDAGLRAILGQGVSRVHALIIREEDGVFLYDIASMNGTYHGGSRVRSVALSEGGTSVEFGGSQPVTLCWRTLD